MTNQEYEELLFEVAMGELRDEYCPSRYTEVTLDEMWDGDTYVSKGGTNMYHEIPAHMTLRGIPMVVSK